MHDELAQIRPDISEIETDITNIKNGTDALPYVKKSGDTMTGTLNIIAGVNNRLMFGTNMGLSADEGEQEVTMANGVGNITLAGKDINFNPATVDGVIRCNDRPIKQVANPTDAQDAATKAYVDANAGGGVEGGFLGNGWTLIQSWNISTEATSLIGITQDLLSKITEIAFIIKLDANQTYSGPFTIDTSNNVADHIYLGNIATQAPALTFALKFLINDKSFNNAGELSCVIINNASSGTTNAASLNKSSIIKSLAADVNGSIDIYWR